MTLHATALKRKVGVPWLTVLPLAVVMAYADGFWLVALRNAFGAVERSHGAFTSWWQESTLALPFFVAAVLSVLTWALRWAGRRRGFVTGLLVAGSGTVVGVAATVVSSAHDYRLEIAQLGAMMSMRASCPIDCLAMQQHATLMIQVKAVLLAVGLMLATNVVLVGWVVALLGGRLRLSVARAAPVSVSRRGHGPMLVIVALLGAAAIHAAVIPEHLAEWPLAALFFALLTVAEIVVARAVADGSGRRALVSAIAVSIGPLAVWLWSRTAGPPFGPEAGAAEAVGLSDVAAVVLELVTLLLAVALWRRHRPSLSIHGRSLAVVTLLAVTVLGLGATIPGVLDDHADQMVMSLE